MSLMTRFEQGAVRLGFLVEQVFSSKMQYPSAGIRACVCVCGEGGSMAPYFVVHELFTKYQSAKATLTNCCSRKINETVSLF